MHVKHGPSAKNHNFTTVYIYGYTSDIRPNLIFIESTYTVLPLILTPGLKFFDHPPAEREKG
jgi:hypothetical protein